ncbi:MAG: hypothetical protein AB9873_19925 [Syntrophobacteraceae bacterium]
MNKLRSMVVVCSAIWLLLLGYSFASEEKITSQHNEFGGKTEDTTYKKGSGKYDDGIWKIVEYYDANGKIREIESYYTDERSKKDGVKKREQYYFQSRTKTLLTKAEFYYTDAYSDYNGIYKCEEKYYENGNKKVSEFFYTDKWAKKRVVSKMIIDYDHRGLEKKRTHYDSKGKIISQEEK